MSKRRDEAIIATVKKWLKANYDRIEGISEERIGREHALTGVKTVRFRGEMESTLRIDPKEMKMVLGQGRGSEDFKLGEIQSKEDLQGLIDDLSNRIEGMASIKVQAFPQLSKTNLTRKQEILAKIDGI